MKRIFLTFAVMIAAILMSPQLNAVPALPRPVTITQPDGTILTIRIYGDERFHYTTTSDGYLIAQRNGIYYYASAGNNGICISNVKANNPSSRGSAEADYLFFKSKKVSQSFMDAAIGNSRKNKASVPSRFEGLDTGFPTKGKIRTLVILANFKDIRFESPTANEDFHNLLNEPGYSQNGATGSARDYYVQNSFEQFDPQFDVVGPVTLSKNASYYGSNDEYGYDINPEEMIIEACRLAKEQMNVNFANYDLNSDGIVDNVFVYYAGTNEAEGGGNDKIWPHRSNLSEDLVIDGKTISVYACTSEINLAGFYPQMAGIGTFCHEFGHVLGWADLYDTDGEYNGLAKGVWDWSLMCVGSYNNEGRTPPAINATERYIAGWLEPEEIYYTGNYTLEALEKSNHAFIVHTDTEGEYFILENRQQSNSVWDQHTAGHGLLIFHVDRSSRMVAGTRAIERWYWNSPNTVSAHQCYKIITARPNSDDGYQAYMPFPGASNNTEFSSKSNPENVSWSGAHIDAELFNISEDNGVISFRAVTSNEERLKVESVDISARESVILNDTIRFKAIITPSNAYNHNVTWASSDESVLSIDENGLGKALKEGTATITVTTEDGGFTDEHTVSVNVSQIFRTRVINSSSFPIAGASVKLQCPDKEYTATSDSKGIIEISGIPQGTYTSEFKAEGYPQQRKNINILIGASVCDATLYTEEELNKGTGNFNVSIQEYETSAFISWTGSEALQWKVEYYPTDKPDKFINTITDVPKINIEGLNRQTAYTVVISEIGEVIEGGFHRKEFTTGTQTSIYPAILINSLYEKGETILLKAANIPDGTTISWEIDGKSTEDIEFKVTGPEHMIKLTIDYGDYSEFIIKHIKVIE